MVLNFGVNFRFVNWTVNTFYERSRSFFRSSNFRELGFLENFIVFVWVLGFFQSVLTTSKFYKATRWYQFTACREFSWFKKTQFYSCISWNLSFFLTSHKKCVLISTRHVSTQQLNSQLERHTCSKDILNSSVSSTFPVHIKSLSPVPKVT